MLISGALDQMRLMSAMPVRRERIVGVATGPSIDETSMVDVLLMHVGSCGQDCNNDDPDRVYSRQLPGQVRPRRPLFFLHAVCVRLQYDAGFKKTARFFCVFSN